jgi:hypothetical protein
VVADALAAGNAVAEAFGVADGAPDDDDAAWDASTARAGPYVQPGAALESPPQADRESTATSDTTTRSRIGGSGRRHRFVRIVTPS